MEGEDGQVSGGPPKMIKAKDLPGAVNVLPAGLGEVLSKRASREIKMEQKGSSVTVSSEGHQQTFSNFQAESKAASSTSTFASSATSSSSANFAKTQQTSASFMQQQQQSSISSSFSSSSATTTQQQSQVKSILKQPKQLTQHGEEIQQESLKSTIQSAITDIEHNLDRTDFADKENVAPSQQQQQQEQEMLRLQQQEQELLRQQEQELLRQQQEEQLRIQQEEQLRIQQEEQLRIQQQNAEQSAAETNSTQNGHFNASDLLRLHDEQRAKLRTPHEFKARPTTANLEELYTPQELDLPDPTTGKKSSNGPSTRIFGAARIHDHCQR